MDNEIVKLTRIFNESYRKTLQLPQTEGNSGAKLNIRAEAFKKDGDSYFCKRSFEDARNSYTLCLANAEEDSEAIGHAYANRSAALFKLGFFEESLFDIDRALNSNYPEDKKKSLRERKERQLASKKAEQSRPLASSRTREVEAEWRNKLCNFHNPLIPGASDKIKLVSNEKWGRHLVATENIDPGEILTCQKFFTMMLTDSQYRFCSYCLLYNPALIPCPTCVLTSVDYECNNSLMLRCLLIGTDQGAGLASLIKKISLLDTIVDVEANIDEFTTEKPFSSDNYTLLLRQCTNFDKSLMQNINHIPRTIIALQKAGYFDNVPDRLKDVTTKDESENETSLLKNVTQGTTQGTTRKKSRIHTRSQRKKFKLQTHHGTGNAPSDSTTSQRKSSTEVTPPSLNSLSASSDANQQIWLKHRGFITREFLDRVTGMLLFKNLIVGPMPTIMDEEPRLNSTLQPQSSSEISTTPSVSLPAISDANEQNVLKHQNVTTKERVNGTSQLKNVTLGTRGNKEPQSDFPSPLKSRRKKNKTRLESSSANSADTNEQKKFKECVGNTSPVKKVTLSTMAEESRLINSTSQPESSTEIPTVPPESLPASSDANEKNLVERQTCLTDMELYVSFLLFNHTTWLEHITFPLEQLYSFVGAHKRYGYGVCILHGLINHSCDSNVNFITRGQETALYATKPIVKGEQIFITYYQQSFLSCSRQERQRILSIKDRFDCECVACVKKWPMAVDLLKWQPTYLYSNKNAAMNGILEIQSSIKGKTADSMSRLEIIQLLVQLCKWIHTNVKRPNVSSVRCEQLLLRAMEHFYDTSSHFELKEIDTKEKMLKFISEAVIYNLNL